MTDEMIDKIMKKARLLKLKADKELEEIDKKKKRGAK